LLFALQRMLLFPRFMINTPPADPPPIMGLERWWIDTAQGRVEAWFLPAEGASPFSPKPAVIFAHGNGELIDHWPEMLAPYRRLGVHVLIPEYRGYGRSTGSPSEVNIVADLSRFYQRLAGRAHVDRKRIIFHGRSIGGGVACALARRHKPRAIILMSTFTSIPALARRYLVPSFLVRDTFDNLDFVSSYDGPMLILHGNQDTLVPVGQARLLHRSAKNSTLVVYNGGHNSFPATAFGEIRRFLINKKIIQR
jgi:fermentation-respiration switch protein FrsA (DUF1100 family)